MTTSETSAPVAVVTGASRGIGRQLCIDLADAGYDVVCAARSTQGRPSNLPGTVDETADEVRAHGRRALAVGLDVRDESAMATFAHMVFDEWRRCDLLVTVSSSAAVWPQFGRASYTTTKRALEAMTESLAHDLRDRVAVNALRIDLPIYSDGFGTTLPDDTAVAFEHPAVATDAVLWLARQPLDHTGRIHTLTELRSTGVVRPTTLYTRATAAAD
jgi:NAD(P)-dependent dehydrogenase (short-subunit alcohol dehydrogenase family)